MNLNHVSIYEKVAPKLFTPSGKVNQQQEVVRAQTCNQPNTSTRTASANQSETSVYIESKTAVLFQTPHCLVSKVGHKQGKVRAKIVRWTCVAKKHIYQID